VFLASQRALVAVSLCEVTRAAQKLDVAGEAKCDEQPVKAVTATAAVSPMLGTVTVQVVNGQQLSMDHVAAGTVAPAAVCFDHLGAVRPPGGGCVSGVSCFPGCRVRCRFGRSPRPRSPRFRPGPVSRAALPACVSRRLGDIDTALAAGTPGCPRIAVNVAEPMARSIISQAAPRCGQVPDYGVDAPPGPLRFPIIPACRWNGRVSGAWAHDVIRAAGQVTA